MKINCANTFKAMVGFTIGTLATLISATAADAEDQRCRFLLNGGFIRWGWQDQQGWFSVPAGSPCHVPTCALTRTNRCAQELAGD